MFEDGVDGYWARQRLKERMDEVDLPYGARAALDPYSSPTGEVYRYTLESPHDTACASCPSCSSGW